jgi:hypothetical protein
VNSELYAELWYNDSQFVALYETAEAYATLLMMGCDCEQEAMDAWTELTVYILQQKYGDDWRNHCKPSMLNYYDEMIGRREKEPLKNTPPVNYGSPPGTHIV